jgi:hypothetical protein
MSFLLVLGLVLVVLFAGYKLIRHDAKAPPDAESYDPNSEPPDA